MILANGIFVYLNFSQTCWSILASTRLFVKILWRKTCRKYNLHSTYLCTTHTKYIPTPQNVGINTVCCVCRIAPFHAFIINQFPCYRCIIKQLFLDFFILILMLSSHSRSALQQYFTRRAWSLYVRFARPVFCFLKFIINLIWQLHK